MPKSTYAFRVRDADGSIRTGSMVAESADEVGSRLRADGKVIISVNENALSGGGDVDIDQIRRREAAKRVKREDVIAFCQQLSVMLETGVPLSEALDSFAAQAPRREFKQVLEIVRDDICSGENFSRAISRWPKVFPSMMVSLLKASEVSGTMSMMLGRIGHYLAKERRTAKQIKGALSYPTFMITAGIAMTVFLMLFVLPRFTKMYDQREASLPRPTKVLIAVSEFLQHQYTYYVPALIVAVVGIWLWRKRPSGRRAFDWLKLNVPVLRTMFSQLYLTRATRTMATLLEAGVNLLDIIDICRGVVSNSYYLDLWNKMERDVRDGLQISSTFAESPIIPPAVASMITAGEKSGRLGEVMERIAAFSEEELDAAVKQTTSFIEPCMIIIMGVVIGGVAMALLLPVFSMGKVMSGG